MLRNLTINSSGVAGIRWLELHNITAGPVTVFHESTYPTGNLALGGVARRWTGTTTWPSALAASLDVSGSDRAVVWKIRRAFPRAATAQKERIGKSSPARFHRHKRIPDLHANHRCCHERKCHQPEGGGGHDLEWLNQNRLLRKSRGWLGWVAVGCAHMGTKNLSKSHASVLVDWAFTLSPNAGFASRRNPFNAVYQLLLSISLLSRLTLHNQNQR